MHSVALKTQVNFSDHASPCGTFSMNKRSTQESPTHSKSNPPKDLNEVYADVLRLIGRLSIGKNRYGREVQGSFHVLQELEIHKDYFRDQVLKSLVR